MDGQLPLNIQVPIFAASGVCACYPQESASAASGSVQMQTLGGLSLRQPFSLFLGLKVQSSTPSTKSPWCVRLPERCSSWFCILRL